MEKKEKAWQRRGLFALVSNRQMDRVPAEDDPLFPGGEEDDPGPTEEE